MTRILIVDDHPIFRQGLFMALSEASDLCVCGEGSSAQEAVDLARELRPDVVLLDLSMPGGGFAALERIRTSEPDLRIAVLTASEDSEDVLKALRLGAHGYVLKGVGGTALIEAVRDVARGVGHVTPTLAAEILSAGRMSDASVDQPMQQEPSSVGKYLLSQLTPRETQVLKLVATGCSNKEVARQADIQEKTVKHHMTHILQKLNVRNRTEAALVLRNCEKAQ